MTKLLIVGGRSFNNPSLMCQFFSKILKKYKANQIQIAHCGTKGAGGMASRFAYAMRMPVTAFHPDFEHDGRTAMVSCADRASTVFQPDMVIAFPGGKSTAAIVLSVQNQCPVYRVDQEGELVENFTDFQSEGEVS